MDVSEAIEKASKVLGSQEKLAAMFGLQKAAVSHWKRQGFVPSNYCPDIEGATGVRCEELCPDVNWAVLRKHPRKTVKQE